MKQFKKRKKKIVFYKNKKILMYSLLGLFLFLGMGYSVLNTDLNIFGSIRVKEYVAPTLYNVLKKEAENSGLAREYTGEHGDSMDSSLSTEKIYHWYAKNDTEGTQVLDKNNVIFAGQCWQMIRTTDTGGVKMIYNGEAENNQCLNTRGNHVGYASRTSQSLNGNYWYGTDYTYDKTNNVFSIAGTTEQATWSEANAPGLIGKYTCKQTTETGTCATLYLVESYNNTTSAYVIPLNANSHYSQFGTLQFNANGSSLADVGYMYNTRYNYNSKHLNSSDDILRSASINTTYWYADSVEWGNPTSNRYNLVSPFQISSTSDYASLVGKYTFTSTSETYTSSGVYYIVAADESTMYYIYLKDNHSLSYYNDTYTYGDSYRDNGSGTYTILNQDETNPVTIERKNWYTSYSSIGAGKYVCKNAVNDTCSDLWYTTSTSNTSMTYIKVSNNYKYSNSFEYKLDPEDNTYKYFLDDTNSVTFWNMDDSANSTSINNNHYTCWNESGKCTELSYIYHLYGVSLPYYIILRNGKSIEDALEDMLSSNNVNRINSVIKSGVDAWYKHYLLEDYDGYIEDTIFCNNRSISNFGGWNPNGGPVNSYPSYILNFKYTNSKSDLSCINTSDKFSISNNNAKLTYKVGLMSSPEMYLLNNNNAKITGQGYWLLTPSYFYNNWGRALAILVNVTANGSYDSSGFYNTSTIIGVRPSISLMPGIEYSNGDGSMASPYIVKMN